jgi:hypothetical protein
MWAVSTAQNEKPCQCTVCQGHVYVKQEPGDKEIHRKARKLNSSFQRLAYVKSSTNSTFKNCRLSTEAPGNWGMRLLFCFGLVLYSACNRPGNPAHSTTKYSAFTDKVERNCNFPAPGRNCYNTGKLNLLFSWSDTCSTH